MEMEQLQLVQKRRIELCLSSPHRTSADGPPIHTTDPPKGRDLAICARFHWLDQTAASTHKFWRFLPASSGYSDRVPVLHSTGRARSSYRRGPAARSLHAG